MRRQGEGSRLRDSPRKQLHVSVVQSAFQNILGRQFGQIMGDMDAGAAQLEQFNLFAAGFSAEDEAQWRFLAMLGFVFGEPGEIEFLLGLVGGLDASQLQISESGGIIRTDRSA